MIVYRSIKTFALLSAVAATLGCARQTVHHTPGGGKATPTREHIGEFSQADRADGKAAPINHSTLPKPFRQSGVASWYGKEFHGRHTASGERFNPMAMTAAHRTLPLGSYVKVTCARSRKSVVVRVNDRGPFRRTRIIDLSYAAAVALGIQQAGTARVEIERIGTPNDARAPKKRFG